MDVSRYVSRARLRSTFQTCLKHQCPSESYSKRGELVLSVDFEEKCCSKGHAFGSDQGYELELKDICSFTKARYTVPQVNSVVDLAMQFRPRAICPSRLSSFSHPQFCFWRNMNANLPFGKSMHFMNEDV
jgi:hypothetical protein